MTASAPTANTPSVAPKSTVYIGQRLTLTESAQGATPFYYQWQTDGGSGGSLTNIPGANSAIVLTTPTTVGTYSYDVIVTNSYGSATSGVVAVTVNPPVTVTADASQPITTMPPQGLGVCSAVYDKRGRCFLVERRRNLHCALSGWFHGRYLQLADDNQERQRKLHQFE
jgi:hypothetical protein